MPRVKALRVEIWLLAPRLSLSNTELANSSRDQHNTRRNQRNTRRDQQYRNNTDPPYNNRTRRPLDPNTLYFLILYHHSYNHLPLFPAFKTNYCWYRNTGFLHMIFYISRLRNRSVAYKKYKNDFSKFNF
jgi:hypothetical protein